VHQAGQSEAVYFMGVDGGGTHCRVRLTSFDGTMLAESQGGSANTTLGPEQVFSEILSCGQQAVSRAGLHPDIWGQTYVGAGLAGLNISLQKTRFANLPHPFAGLVVCSDAHTACLGAHNGGDGGIVICGTGSAGLALIGGSEHRVGGWGFVLSDSGGGAILGRNLLRACLEVHDGLRPPSEMASAVLDRFNHDGDEMFEWAYRATPRDFGFFAPTAFDWADRNDPLARRLVTETVTAVSHHISAVRAHGADRICLLGGMAARVQPLLPVDTNNLLVVPVHDALQGAILLARRQHAQSLTKSGGSR